MNLLGSNLSFRQTNLVFNQVVDRTLSGMDPWVLCLVTYNLSDLTVL